MQRSSAVVRVGACQVPEIQRDIEEAIECMEHWSEKAALEGVKLLCFPECFLQGYLVEPEEARQHALDLSSPPFARVLGCLANVRPMLVFGMIECERDKLFNTAVVVDGGRAVGRYRKTHLLPGERAFEPGTEYPVFSLDGVKFGINICYDTQFPETAAVLAAQNVDLILCPSNNMMRRTSADEWREKHLPIRAERAREARAWLLSSDVVGEREQRVSYGTTSAIDPEGTVRAQVPALEVGMVVAEVPSGISFPQKRA